MVTFFASLSGTRFVPLGNAFLLIKVLVEPGSNSTFNKDLNFFNHMVSTSIMDIGVRLLSRGVPFLGTGTM